MPRPLIKKIKVVRTVTTSALVSMHAYAGMTPEEAASYERNISEDEAVEALLAELADDSDGITVTTEATVVEVEDGD